MNNILKKSIEDNKSILLKNIGECLRKEREEKGISRKVLADKINISENYIGYIEQGKYSISLLKFLLYINELDINPNYIIRKSIDMICRENISVKNDLYEEKDIVKEVFMYLKGI